MLARVIVLAGPSGSGKSRLAARSGKPVLRLDDYYKGVSERDLPLIESGANAGLVDWDDPRSWNLDAAMAGITQLCETGHTAVPVYSIPESRPVGEQVLDLAGAPLFVAEGIFAAEVVRRCEDAGLLAAAICVRQHPALTFWRRLTRDLRERRKPPLVLVRRGLALMRAQKAVVSAAVAKGCVPMHPDRATAHMSALAEGVQP